MAPVSFAALRLDLLALYRPPLRRKATYFKLRQVLGELAALELAPAADLTPAAVARWLERFAGPRRPATVRSLLRVMRTVCHYAEEFGGLERSPFRWRSPDRWLGERLAGDLPAASRRHLSRDELGRVLAQADAEAVTWRARRRRALVYLLAYTGMRKSEALGLEVGDCDFVEGLVSIRANRARVLKTASSAAWLALAAPVLEVLRGWSRECGSAWLFPGVRRRRPWLGGGPGGRAVDEVKALGRRAGVPGVTLLVFRHTLATLAEVGGLGELELQRQLRHSSPRTQAGYRHTDIDELKRTAVKLGFLLRAE
jgi:integrase